MGTMASLRLAFAIALGLAAWLLASVGVFVAGACVALGKAAEWFLDDTH